MKPLFDSRQDAGRALARELGHLAGRDDLIVLALPRGGVPVAYEVARALSAPLDVFIVRKLGLPGHEELAIGAIASGGTRVLNEDIIDAYGLFNDQIDAITRREQQELERRERAYRGDRPSLELRGKTVVLIDDGLATGATMKAAAAAIRAKVPAQIVIAVPVAASSTCEELSRLGYRVVCARTPEPFQAVGVWYRDFAQTTDEEVHTLLELAQEEPPERRPSVNPGHSWRPR